MKIFMLAKCRTSAMTVREFAIKTISIFCLTRIYCNLDTGTTQLVTTFLSLYL